MNNNLNEPQPLACDLTAIPAPVREEHIVARLIGAVYFSLLECFRLAWR